MGGPCAFSGGVLSNPSSLQKVGQFPFLKRSPGAFEGMGSLFVVAWHCHHSAVTAFVQQSEKNLLPLTVPFAVLRPQIHEEENDGILFEECVVHPSGNLFFHTKTEGPEARHSIARAAGLAEKQLINWGPSERILQMGTFNKSLAILIHGETGLRLELFGNDLSYTATIPIRFPASLENTEWRINGRSVLAYQDGLFWIGKANQNLPDTTTMGLEQISIAPCAEEIEKQCGVSLASDDTWLISGYWGTYAGKGTQYKRIPLNNFSSDSFPITVSHSGIPGNYALLGEDDSDLGQLQLALSLPLQQPTQPKIDSAQNADSKPQRSIAWLRPEEPLQPEEKLLFSDDLGLQVVLGQEPFDSERHVLFEHEQDLQILKNAPSKKNLPQDTFAPQNTWWSNALGIDELFELVRDRKTEPAPVHVAVLDSGADFSHPLFELPQSPLDLPGNGLDDDQNGYIDDSFGYDFIEEDALPQDQNGHGTHVSGLAKPNHPFFAAIDLTVVRVLDENGRSNSLDIGRGFIYAADQGAHIINASWGGGPKTFFMEEAILYAQKNGSLVISSAGNDGFNIDDNPPSPLHIPQVVGVGSFQSSKKRSGFSNYGENTVFTFQPGSDIQSLRLGGGLEQRSGTSFAAPLYAAMLAAQVSYLLGSDQSISHQNAIQKVMAAHCAYPQEGFRKLKSTCTPPNHAKALRSLLAD